ncbi:MAG: hypothetical protein FWF08_03665 [Oscillospiraceae bacterium]|nr:hypothetical protein [Oscillospiraceae bacterium]
MKNNKTSLIFSAFIVTIAVTVVFIPRLLKNAGKNKEAANFIKINWCNENNTVRALNESDIGMIEKFIDEEFAKKGFLCVPVYTCMGLGFNGGGLNLFAIDRNNGILAGLEKELEDNTVYFTEGQDETAEIDISVITFMDENGFVSDRLEHIRLNAEAGVSAETPVISGQMQGMMPNPACFVNMETFGEIIAVLASDIGEGKSREAGLIRIEGIYLFAEDAKFVDFGAVSSFFEGNGYI